MARCCDGCRCEELDELTRLREDVREYEAIWPLRKALDENARLREELNEAKVRREWERRERVEAEAELARLREAEAESARMFNEVTGQQAAELASLREERAAFERDYGALYEELARLREVERWARLVAAPPGANDFQALMQGLRNALKETT